MKALQHTQKAMSLYLVSSVQFLLAQANKTYKRVTFGKFCNTISKKKTWEDYIQPTHPMYAPDSKLLGIRYD